MKVLDVFKWILWIPVLAIGVFIAFFSQLLEKRIERSGEEVEGILIKMESGAVSEDLWDDFLSTPIFDKHLDKVREKVEVLWAYDDFQTKNEDGCYVLSEKGLSEIREILNELKST